MTPDGKDSGFWPDGPLVIGTPAGAGTCRLEGLFGPAGTRDGGCFFDRFEQLGEGRVLGQKRQERGAVELLAVGRVFEEPGVGGPLEEF